MFGKVGGFCIRYRWGVIAFWLLLTVAMVLFAPSIAKVGLTDQQAFLPANSPSVTDGTLIYEKFPEKAAFGDTIIFFRAAGLTQADREYAQEVGAWLQSPDAPAEVSGVRSVFSNPELEALLVSKDGTTMLMTLGFSTAISSEPTNRAVDKIRERLTDPPAGLELYTAGSGSMARDLLGTVKKSMDSTTWATVILVIVVLLLIYRSPVASLVPLLTISAAYLVSRGVLGYLAQAGLKISTNMEIFAIVVVFGVGTDYCLFIVSRFREELQRLPTRFEAGVRTMERIGAVIAASATVVILAFLFLNVAEFGQTRSLGTGLAVAIFVTLLAGLTLTPALMSVVGDKLFWPFTNATKQAERGFWHSLAAWVPRNAAWLVPVVVILLLLPYIFLPQLVRNFDILADIPPDMGSASGFNTLKGHFDPGELFPATVMLVAENGNIQGHLKEIDATASVIRQTSGVARVRSILTPTGDPSEAKLFLVDAQLAELAQSVNDSVAALASGNLEGAGGADPVKAVEAIGTYLEDLAMAYPDAKSTGSYQTAVDRAKTSANALATLVDKLSVTTQLETIAENVGSLAQVLRSPSLVTDPGVLGDGTKDLDTLKQYLAGIAEQFPFVKGEASYAAALGGLSSLEASLPELQKGLYVSGQLEMIAGKLDELAKKMDNPLALAGTDTQQQFVAMQAYLEGLVQKYPWVESERAYQDVQAHFMELSATALRLTGGQVSQTDMLRILGELKEQTTAMAESLRSLSAVFAARDPKAAYVPKDIPGGLGSTQDAANQAEELGLSLLQLGKAFQENQPNARYVAAGLMTQGDMMQQGIRLIGDLRALASALGELGQSFAGKQSYLYPESLLAMEPGAEGLATAFFSKDGTATRMYVILEPEPYSNRALDVSQEVRKAAVGAVQGKGLTAYATGTSSAFADIRNVSGKDFVKVLLLTLVGVFVVMVILLRSVVAPVYLVLTVLLSYGSTLSLCVLVFQRLLGQDGLNLMIPVSVLVLLVALGADYNIFLMSRVREETREGDFLQGLTNATSRTGAIITSCGIVLAGTFATMILSPMTLMLQTGASVAFGVLLDTFVIRAVLVPAIASLLKKRSWWPARQ